MNDSPENEKLLIPHSALCLWGLKTKLMCRRAKVLSFIHKHECTQELGGSRTTADSNKYKKSTLNRDYLISFRFRSSKPCALISAAASVVTASRRSSFGTNTHSTSPSAPYTRHGSARSHLGRQETTRVQLKDRPFYKFPQYKTKFNQK